MKRKATEGGRKASRFNLKTMSLSTSIRERWLLFHDTVVGEKDIWDFFKEVGEGLGSEGVG